MEVIKINEGVIYWGSYETEYKAIISNAKLNVEKQVITIDVKESTSYDPYSIALSSEDSFNFKGSFNSVSSSSQDSVEKGGLFMKYFKKDKHHVLVGKWIESGEATLCLIELNEN